MALDPLQLWPGLPLCVSGRKAERILDILDVGRRFYDEKTGEWQASLAGDRLAQGKACNAARIFLIRKAIFFQLGLQVGRNAD